MAITGAVGAALRQEAPYQAEIQMGAQLVMDFQGSRSGGRPYYWYRGTRYTRPEKIPGWSFSRNSAGTAETLAGNIIQFPANELRITDRGLLIEEARQQLARNNRFQDWSGSVPNGYGSPILARIGKVAGGLGANALKLFGPFANDGNRVAVPALPEMTASTAYSLTARVRKTRGAAAILALAIDTWGSNALVLDLSAVPLNQWVTLTVTGTSSASVGNGGGFHTSSVDCDIEIDWWQLEAGSFRTSAIINDGQSAVTRAADSASINAQAAILGQFRTNLITYSDQFDNAAWAKNNVNVTANAAVAPDGSNAADRLVDTAAAGAPHVAIQVPASAFTGATFSVYAKKGERTWIWMYFGSYAAGAAWFDLNAGVVGTVEASVSATITDAGGGWYRCSIRQTTASTANTVAIGLAVANGSGNYTGDGVSGAYVFGAQLEVAASPTQYIPASVAPASAGNPFTLVAWTDLPAADTVARALASVDDTTAGNRVELQRSGDGSVTATPYVTGGMFSFPTGSFAAKTGARVLKFGVRVRAGSAADTADGVAPIISTPVAAPTALNRIIVGSSTVATRYVNGYVRGFAVLGDVDDAQLARLVA